MYSSTYAIFLEGHNHVIFQQRCQLLGELRLGHRLQGGLRHTGIQGVSIMDTFNWWITAVAKQTHLLAPHRKTGVCSAKAAPMTHNAISDFHNISLDPLTSWVLRV